MNSFLTVAVEVAKLWVLAGIFMSLRDLIILVQGVKSELVLTRMKRDIDQINKKT